MKGGVGEVSILNELGYDDDHTFEPSPGVVIDLDTIVSGGRAGILRDLEAALRGSEQEAEELDEEIAPIREGLEKKELELARALARRDAYKLALQAAREVLS